MSDDLHGVFPTRFIRFVWSDLKGDVFIGEVTPIYSL